MGLYSSGTISIDSVKLCVFDSRRGQREGQEVEKLLFFYPSELPLTEQQSVVGLSEGLITFTRLFSPDAACDVIEAERHSHVFYEAEPDIWMVMVVEKKKELEEIWRIEALKDMLKEVHSLFVMFNGSIRAMLDKESAGALVRSHLFSFITDYLFACQKPYPLDFCCWDFISGKKLQLPSFRDSLQERGTVQMLTVGREAAIEIQVCSCWLFAFYAHIYALTNWTNGQSLVRVLESGVGSAACHSLILFNDLLVSTSVSPDDTVNLYTYAVMRMSPRALSTSKSSWSYLRKGNAAAHVGSRSVLPISSSERVQESRHTTSSGDNRYLIARPLQQDKWSKGKDGFLVTNQWGADVNALFPTVWLQQTKEQMYLCAHQHKNVTILLLVPVSSINDADREIPVVKLQLLENASLKILKVEEKLAKGWGGENAYHVGGYRYLLIDGDRNVSRASPAAKAATLAKESLIAMCKLREVVDLEKRSANDGSHEKDLEVCIRAKNNAWVVARVARGKELYVVLERAEETLLYASDAIEKFSNRYCGGAFS